MADTPEDDELLLDQQAPEEGNEQEGQGQGSEEAGEMATDELEVTFGDGAAPAPGEGESSLIKHLRKELREAQQRLREVGQPERIEVGPRPRLPDYDYDEEKHDAALDEWLERKERADAQSRQSSQTEDHGREQWQRDLQSFEAKKAQLNFSDAEEMIAAAVTVLSDVQQAVIVKAADNPAKLLYALGKHPAKLAETSQITDPLKLAGAVARLEGGLKVMPKRRAPDPEEIASGNKGTLKGSDKELERLEKEADRTGDRTKLIAYRKQLKRA